MSPAHEPGRADEPGALTDSSTEDAPAGASAVFGPRLPLAQHYAALLAGAGVERGLIGPREVPRLWDRHLLNCAVLSELLPPGVRVVDVGSGAGLPGVVLAIRRPDIQVDLVEPLQRRSTFLSEAVAELQLDEQVRVVRGRAEDPETLARVGSSDWVTARAVAPLDRLVRWCLPLLRRDGWLLAMKGATAAEEIARDSAAIAAQGGYGIAVRQVGIDVLSEPTFVVTVRRGARDVPRRRGGAR